MSSPQRLAIIYPDGGKNMKGTYFDTYTNLGAVHVAVSQKNSTIYVYVFLREWRLKELIDLEGTYRTCIIETKADYAKWISYLKKLDQFMFHNFKLPKLVPIKSPFSLDQCEDFINEREISSIGKKQDYDHSRKPKQIQSPILPTTVILPPLKGFTPSKQPNPSSSSSSSSSDQSVNLPLTRFGSLDRKIEQIRSAPITPREPYNPPQKEESPDSMGSMHFERPLRRGFYTAQLNPKFAQQLEKGYLSGPPSPRD